MLTSQVKRTHKSPFIVFFHFSLLYFHFSFFHFSFYHYLCPRKPRNAINYAEAVPFHNGTLPEALPQVLGLVGRAQLPLTMDERVLVHGPHPYPQHSVQDRPGRIYLQAF